MSDLKHAVEAAASAMHRATEGRTYSRESAPEFFRDCARACLPFLAPDAQADVESGLDFEKAKQAVVNEHYVAGESTRLSRNDVYNAELQRQHKAVVAPLEAKVKELTAAHQTLRGQLERIANALPQEWAGDVARRALNGETPR